MINPIYAALGPALREVIESQVPFAPIASPVAYSALNTVLAAYQEGSCSPIACR